MTEQAPQQEISIPLAPTELPKSATGAEGYYGLLSDAVQTLEAGHENEETATRLRVGISEEAKNIYAEEHVTGGHTIPGTDEYIPGETVRTYYFLLPDADTKQPTLFVMPNELAESILPYKPVETQNDQTNAEAPADAVAPEAVVEEAGDNYQIPTLEELDEVKAINDGITRRKGRYYNAEGVEIDKADAKDARKLAKKNWLLSDEEHADFSRLAELASAKDMTAADKQFVKSLAEEYELPSGTKKSFRAAQSIARRRLNLSNALEERINTENTERIGTLVHELSEKGAVPTHEQFRTLQSLAESIRVDVTKKGKEKFFVGSNRINKSEAGELMTLADPDTWLLSERRTLRDKLQERRGIDTGKDFVMDYANAIEAKKASQLSTGASMAMERFVTRNNFGDLSKKQQFQQFKAYAEKRFDLHTELIGLDDNGQRSHTPDHVSRRTIESKQRNSGFEQLIDGDGSLLLLGNLSVKGYQSSEARHTKESTTAKKSLFRRMGRAVLGPSGYEAPDIKEYQEQSKPQKKASKKTSKK